MTVETVRKDMQELIWDVKVAIARIGADLYNFDHLLRHEPMAGVEKELTMLHDLLAAVSAHMHAIRARNRLARRAEEVMAGPRASRESTRTEGT